MLGKLLSKESCARCRFCCSFRRQSLWELPRVPLDFCDAHPLGADGQTVKYLIGESRGMRYAVTDLEGGYMTEDPEEEVKCPFLDESRGCTLSGEDKPFECKIWPLRYMELRGGEKRIALTPTCPEINRVSPEDIRELLSDGTGEKIIEYAREYPFIIKEYREGFLVF